MKTCCVFLTFFFNVILCIGFASVSYGSVLHVDSDSSLVNFDKKANARQTNTAKKEKPEKKEKKEKKEKEDKNSKNKKPSTSTKKNKNITNVKKLLKTGNFAQAAEILIALLKSSPDDPELIKLKNEACLKAGNSYLKKGKIIEADKMYSYVDKGYGNIKTIKLKIRRQKKKHAQLNYCDGIKHFTNEQFELAIKKWELTLLLNPDHLQAAANIKKAKALLKKLKNLQ